MLGNLLDAWYFTAIDIRTGQTVWSRLTGTGIQWNNHYSADLPGTRRHGVRRHSGRPGPDQGPVKTYVVSGAASGIGAATASLLRDEGDRVITVDLRDADVIADLSTGAGRATAVAGVQELTDVVHGLVPCAGLGGFTGVDSALVVSVNFFGAVGLVRGLRSQLAAAGGASVVLLASNSITGMPGWNASVAGHCLRDDEPAARAAASRGRLGDGLSRHEGGARLVGPPRGRDRAVDRAGHPAQLGRARHGRHPDDRTAPGRPAARPVRRQLPDRGRAARASPGRSRP